MTDPITVFGTPIQEFCTESGPAIGLRAGDVCDLKAGHKEPHHPHACDHPYHPCRFCLALQESRWQRGKNR